MVVKTSGDGWYPYAAGMPSNLCGADAAREPR